MSVVPTTAFHTFVYRNITPPHLQWFSVNLRVIFLRTNQVSVEKESSLVRHTASTRKLTGLKSTNDNTLLHKLQHELLRNYSPPGIDCDFHAADLLVDVFHELDDEIDQLMLPQLLQVRVSHEKADIESLHTQRARINTCLMLQNAGDIHHRVRHTPSSIRSASKGRMKCTS